MYREDLAEKEEKEKANYEKVMDDVWKESRG